MRHTCQPERDATMEGSGASGVKGGERGERLFSNVIVSSLHEMVLAILKVETRGRPHENWTHWADCHVQRRIQYPLRSSGQEMIQEHACVSHGSGFSKPPRKAQAAWGLSCS